MTKKMLGMESPLLKSSSACRGPDTCVQRREAGGSKSKMVSSKKRKMPSSTISIVKRGAKLQPAVEAARKTEYGELKLKWGGKDA